MESLDNQRAVLGPWSQIVVFSDRAHSMNPFRLALPCLLVISWVMMVWAGELPTPPPLKDEPVEEQAYLQAIYRHMNNLVVVTSNPDGSRRGRLGDLLAYNNAGSYKLCICTSTGPAGGTTWRCSANALTAP